MDTRRNHLILAEDMESLNAETRERYKAVPPELEDEAKRLLGGSRQVRVPRSSKSPVARWAAEERRRAREAKRSETTVARRQLQKQSRKRNRG